MNRLSQHTETVFSQKEKSAVEKFLAKHQQWVIGLVVLPLSFAVKHSEMFANWVNKKRQGRVSGNSLPHALKIRRVVEDVKQWAAIPAAARPPIRTDRSGAASHSVRTADKAGSHRIRMSDFNEILAISLEKNTVTVEPFVTVGELTKYLLQYDRMLEATLEMEDATLGGLAMSQGMTTHSHRCGLVHDTVECYEFVTGEGELIRATPTENADFYRAAGFSHGTLGFLTSLELRLVPAGKELLVTYFKADSIAQLYQLYAQQILHTEAFFLEAIVFSKTHAVLVRGDLLTPETKRAALAQGVKINQQGRWYKPWFFKHVENARDGQRELMPMHDYLMRHDRSMCMTTLYVFPIGNHPLFRYLFGWLLPPKVTFLKSLRPPEARIEAAREQVYQDLAFPMDCLPDMIDYVDDALGIYPLLVYPCKVIDRGGFIRLPKNIRGAAESIGENSLNTRDMYYLNLGIYGIPRGIRENDSQFNTVQVVRELLAKVRALGGFQHSYCDVFQTRDEFYQMFDESLAQSVRSKHGSDQLVTVYDKVKPEIEWESWV